MPIPGVSPKKKDQSWRKNIKNKKSISTASFSKKGVYTGKSKRKFKINFEANKFFKYLLTFFVIAIGLGGLVSIFILGWIAKDLPNPNRIIDRSIAQSTKIYDRTGKNLLYDVHGDIKRTVVKLEEIPEYVIHATLAAEDRKFYEHKGISITGILRSAIKNVTTGSKVGGSTLTQQLVKNAILSPEKKYSRKIKEIILSYQIEKKFTKDEILQLYFNEIPYGSVAYGAEAAAQTYFGKSIREVSLAEAAILAALPQAPTFYSPYGSHTDRLFARQQWVLDSMAEVGYITEEEARLTKEEKVEFKKRSENIVAPHFVMYVREYLTEKYGEVAVEQGGLQVITTLDLYKQEIAEKVIAQQAEKNIENYDANNAALIAIDTKTGQILSMVGSRDYFAESTPEDCTPGVNCKFDPQVNAALRLRQPGSSFKPIVYTAAFKKGYTPDTVLYDVVTKFKNYDGKDYEPKNYDLAEHGPVTIKKALAGSLNIPAVKAIYLTGVDNVIDLAEDLGYSSFTQRSRFGLSLVLGGGEVRLIEHTNAFATLAREGEIHPVAAILEVKDKDGNILEKFEDKSKKVLETEVARQINIAMSDNEARAYVFGENNKLNLGSRPVAAKTGTTNDYRDAWTVGYTPSLAVGVWVGNNNNEEMKRGATGGAVAAPIWHGFMSQVLGDIPIEYFKEPKEIETDKPVLNGSIIDGVKVKVDKISGKLATNLTPDFFVEEKTFRQVHSILYYIDKDDPRGDREPTRSGDQYERWEEAVARWAEENEYINEEPPTEYDDTHTLANRPELKIISPSKNQLITNRDFEARINVFAPRGVDRVDYYINDVLITTTRSKPFDLSITIEDPTIGNGFYPFKVVAYDDVGNFREQEIDLKFQLPEIPISFSWTAPDNGKNFNPSDFPISLKANINDSSNIKRVELFYKDENQNSNYINTIRQFPENQLDAKWFQNPGSGSYKIYAEIETKTEYRYKSKEITVSIN